ncbi:MAG: hypothetical protein ABSE72_07250 [Bacteroidales bacterium]
MKNKYFDINELDPDIIIQPPEQKSGILVEKFFQIHREKVESIKQLAGRIPGKDEIYFLWTVNSFNAFTFIPFILKEAGKVIHLILSTYSINIRIIDALIKLIDNGSIMKVDIFISDSVRSRLPKVYDYLISLVEKYPVTVKYSWNHSKIALIRTSDHYFCVEGSGNWGENAQHEQYIFLNSKSVFEFRKNEILNGMDNATV